MSSITAELYEKNYDSTFIQTVECIIATLVPILSSFTQSIRLHADEYEVRVRFEDYAYIRISVEDASSVSVLYYGPENHQYMVAGPLSSLEKTILPTIRSWPI